MMRTTFYGMGLVMGMACLVASGGCGSQTPSDPAPTDASESPPAADAHDHDNDHSGHDHSKEHKGPHNGHVIELGRNHEYHAELVEDDDAGTVTVYILGKDVKELAIDAPTIVMNLMVDGQAKTFELAATGATDGKASRFDAADRTLFEALHEHEATGKLRVTIDGTPYSGDVEHHHHGDEHGHDDHDDHDDGDNHKH